jgi:hypothetical protein
MCQAYNCLPTDLWHFDPRTPKGFYFNRGVFYFGRKVTNAMQKAEARSRKNRTGATAERLGNAASLAVLEQYLGAPVKRHRDPGSSDIKSASAPVVDSSINKKEEPTVLMRES